MNSDTAWNMYVFRDGRRTFSGATLARDLAGAILSLFEPTASRLQDRLIDVLLRAGEFECALADAKLPASRDVAQITDALAEALVGGNGLNVTSEELLRKIPQNISAEMRVSPPEGFAYYALHPLDYADMTTEMRLSSGTVCVVGIRSIGVTLSAIVAAAFRLRGIRTIRFNVRPTGHPYNRTMELSAEQRRLVSNGCSEGGEFVVVDEGPGMSGSSFLSVGEALEEAGAPVEKITFLCSRTPDPDGLRSSNGGERWRRFRACYSRRNWRLPSGAQFYIGGGEWRSVLGNDGELPATWTQMERLKFLSEDRRLFLKFEGFGQYGSAVVERANRIASAGFGPMPLDSTQGFAFYETVSGTPATKRQLSRDDIDRIAAYCAFRTTAFRCEGIESTDLLETMVQFNIAQEFGAEGVIPEGSLGSRYPVLVDGRMSPHEWIVAPDGKLIKTDNASHGDDHFFPGPTDIAWDLAGTMVEWNMDEQASDLLISEYQRLSGDNPRERIGSFLLAYSVFRLAYCKMAAAALGGTAEEDILMRAYRYYRAAARSRLGREMDPMPA